jgi:hypothetical protein
MFNTNRKQVIEVAVEYRAPHWMVLTRNPGQKTWEPVRSKTRKVNVQDEFGVIVKTYPAIESFSTQECAETWIQDNIAKHERKPRSKSTFSTWLSGEKASTQKYQYTTA